MDNDILIVTGMHRSGTSLITHWLHACGLQLGDRLLNGGKGNVEGHFEDLEFLNLHEEILASQTGDSDGLRGHFDVHPTLGDKARMAAIVSVKNARYPQWGWKEPRTCLFLDAYAEQLPNAKYLVVLRDYKEVVQSLLKRDFSYIEDKYAARSWPVRMLWQHFYRPMRLNQHRLKNHDRYLQAWIAYNRMILKALRSLPEERYLVVSYKSMKDQCGEVFDFLTSQWSFLLRYRKFSSIYRSELITRDTSHLPETENDDLLDEAQQVSGQLRSYLKKSSERLASQEALAVSV